MTQREIKFRAWDKLQNKMHYGLELFQIPAWSEPMTHASQVDVMQFTGLHDKNGVEIYEGDIVRCFDTAGGLVYDHEIKLPEFFREIWSETTWDDEKKERTNTTKVEVIGNIYENPELLTPTKE